MRFLQGDPESTFSNGIQLGDSDSDGTVDDPVKLFGVRNSKPVIVASPLGIGLPIERWTAFRSLELARERPAESPRDLAVAWQGSRNAHQ